jgi:DUF2959 family protein
VIRSHFARPVAVILPVLLGLAACASTTEQAASVRQVDDLLTNIESVQVDVTMAKDKAHAALQQLTTLVSPKFTGDATKAYAALKEGIKASEEQSLHLRRSVEPMASSAESVFQRWASDLEAFGNTRMRQRSQARLDETRARYQTLLTSSQSALLSFDSFNADLKDQALFLGSDLNASAIAAITPDVRVLHQQVQDLDARADACANAARAYIESAALYGQVETVNTTEVPQGQMNNTASNQASTDKPKTQFTKRRTSTLKPHALPPAPRPAEPAPAPEAGIETTPDPAPVQPPVSGPGRN